MAKPISGHTTRALIFHPEPGRTKNTWDATIPAGFPVRATGGGGLWLLRASLDYDDDYQKLATAEDFTPDSEAS